MRTALTTLKTAVVAPMPSASVPTAASGEAGIAPNHPQRQPHVLRQPLDPANAVHAVRVFAKTQRIPDLPSRRGARLLEWHAFGTQLVSPFGEVEVELPIDVALDS